MKINTSPLFLEGLDSARLEVYKLLKPFSSDFVLAGGTAIMLQINHRKSYDFDLFTTKPFPKQTLSKFKRIFGESISVVVENDEILLLKTKDKIDVHFVVEPNKLLYPAIKTHFLPLQCLHDLAANKAHVVGRRGAWRDYVDLFFLLKWNLYSIEKLINLSKKKFGFGFNERLFVQQLSYFADIPVTPVTFLKEKYTNEEIQSYLQDSVFFYCHNNPKFH